MGQGTCYRESEPPLIGSTDLFPHILVQYTDTQGYITSSLYKDRKVTMAVVPTNNTERVKLNTGAEIPIVGLGTWQATGNDGNDCYEAVLAALRAGYRHIDTAAIYGNEDQVGRAIRDSGIPREEIFLTTKLWCTQHREAAAALDQSLERLGTDYVDLYLMHWPVALKTRFITDGKILSFPTREDGLRDVDVKDWNFIKTWHLMQELLASGKVKAIGISNFTEARINELLSAPGTTVVPAVNQVENHPLLPQHSLVKFCKAKGIAIECYSPLGSSDAPVLKEPAIVKIADKLGIQPAQVVISWQVQRGNIVLPKSVHESRIQANLKTVVLPDEDFEALNNLSKQSGERRIISGEFFAPFKPF